MPRILFFPYFGPNRRSEKRVIEIRLDFEPEDRDGFPGHESDIRELLVAGGILAPKEDFPVQALPAERNAWYASLLAQTALLFQRRTGHRVDFFSVSTFPKQNRCLAFVEHEHSDVGMTAVKLAVELQTGKRRLLGEPFRQFSEFARERLLPPETAAIIRAAQHRDIPVFQLDRQPLAGNEKRGFRVRRNGLLMLGHGAAHRVLDGTFSPSLADDYLRALLRNPDQRIALLKKLGTTLAGQGYASKAVAGRFHVLAIDGQIIGASESADGRRRPVDKVHASFAGLALAIHREAKGMPVAVTVLTPDISRALETTGGGVVDFELAPDLAAFADQGRDTPLLDKTANLLLDQLFPRGQPARMPIIAVTGTNGKTTTCRMIAHILKHSGRRPGLVVSDGIYLDGEQISLDDASAFVGHARALASKRVDVAVLETHHRGIAVRGFAFDWCDVAVCLNVTHDHIEAEGIESLAEMAELKRALPERARHAAVLFADDPLCVAMLGHVTAGKVCLVSLQSGAEELSALVENRPAGFCVLERISGEEWLVILDEGRRSPVLPVAGIPGSFGGTARFNVSNAMHAAMAVSQAGVPVGHIGAALRSFSAGWEATPWRMNEFAGLPFRLIMDFAHNPDGLCKLSDFVARQQVPGRRILAIPGSSKRTDETNLQMAAAVAGHFDYYFCKDYEPTEPPKRRFVAPLMRQYLVAAGVPESQTTVVTFGKDVIHRILDFCEPGDLLIILVGNAEKKTVPGYIKEYLAR